MPYSTAAPNLTTTARDALPQADRAKGTIIYNTSTARLEINDGTAATPVWNTVGGNAAQYGTALPTTSLANGQIFTLFVSYASGYVAWNCMYRVDLDATYPWHVMGGPPMILSGSATLPRGGQWMLSAKGWANTSGGTTTGANLPINLILGGSTIDTTQTSNVPANSGALFNYGGSSSFYGTNNVVGLGTGTAGTTVSTNMGSNVVFTLMPIKII